ncbi:class I SAM-dependent methyltransferase [Gracilibacillus sp. HCP3S3_G5_1]|uniref:class I SAM-dependent methyltransferase n=1 Tax=unclassified Gracilibacillus TaxID=2625209 RepID=UPI003F8B2FC4
MAINFHSEKNRATYATRDADCTWKKAVKELVPIEHISHALDIGSGGGIYTKALAEMGIETITGIDFSEVILATAKENCKTYPNISFIYANALDTGLKGDSADLLLERALIHHITDVETCFQEGYRLLKNDGYYIVQDRTPEDCLLSGNEHHIRGYFFEVFPDLKEKEINRRHKSLVVKELLQQIGFREVEKRTLWETRKIYETKAELLQDLRARTGRSILHELTDHELNRLVDYVDKAITIDQHIVDKDRWTIWKAVK